MAPMTPVTTARAKRPGDARVTNAWLRLDPRRAQFQMKYLDGCLGERSQRRAVENEARWRLLCPTRGAGKGRSSEGGQLRWSQLLLLRRSTELLRPVFANSQLFSSWFGRKVGLASLIPGVADDGCWGRVVMMQVHTEAKFSRWATDPGKNWSAVMSRAVSRCKICNPYVRTSYRDVWYG